MSKYTITLTYKNDVNVFRSDNLDECYLFLVSIPRNRKFKNINISYVLEDQKNTYNVIDKETGKILKVIPKEIGTSMLFCIHEILLRNNRL